VRLLWRGGAIDDGHAEVVVEAKVLRAGAEGGLPVVASFFETEMPFSKGGGVVSFIFKEISDGEGFGVDEEGRGDGSWSPDSFSVVGAKGVLSG